MMVSLKDFCDTEQGWLFIAPKCVKSQFYEVDGFSGRLKCHTELGREMLFVMFYNVLLINGVMVSWEDFNVTQNLVGKYCL